MVPGNVQWAIMADGTCSGIDDDVTFLNHCDQPEEEGKFECVLSN